MCFMENSAIESKNDEKPEQKADDCCASQTTTASTSDEMMIVEAPPFRPDAYAEDGTSIVFIN